VLGSFCSRLPPSQFVREKASSQFVWEKASSQFVWEKACTDSASCLLLPTDNFRRDSWRGSVIFSFLIYLPYSKTDNRIQLLSKGEMIFCHSKNYLCILLQIFIFIKKAVFEHHDS
jgi:hypothetical protein